MAARTAMEAVDAAMAEPAAGNQKPPAPRPAPRFETPVSRTQTSSAPIGVIEPPPSRSVPRAAAVQAARLSPAARAATGKVAGPLRAASRALWLEVTGSFFALFAITFGGGAWRLRASITAAAPGANRHNFYIFLIMAMLFGYFSVSSFLRANKR